LVETLSRIGICHYAQAEYAPALEAQLKVLKISENLQNADSRFYNQLQANLNVGAIYKQLDDSEKALLYFEKAKQLAQQEQDEGSFAGALTNIGTVYDDQGDLQKAKENYEEALIIFTNLEDVSSQSVVCNNLGDIYRKLGKYKESLQYHLKSLKIKKEIGDQRGIASSFSSIALLYMTQEEHAQALIYLQKALQTSVKIKADDIQKEVLKAMADTYAAQENYASAYEYYKKYSELKDSLALSSSSMTEILGQYGADRRELKLKLTQTEQKLEESRQNAERWYLYLIMVAITGGIMAISLGINLVRKSSRLKNLQARLKKEDDKSTVSKPTS
jgi:tetratricopeptide (TPR) repeat protein